MERNQEGASILLRMVASMSRRTDQAESRAAGWLLRTSRTHCAVCSPALPCDPISACTVSHTVKLISLPLPAPFPYQHLDYPPLRAGKQHTYPPGKRNYSSKYYKIQTLCLIWYLQDFPYLCAPTCMF